MILEKRLNVRKNQNNYKILFCCDPTVIIIYNIIFDSGKFWPLEHFFFFLSHDPYRAVIFWTIWITTIIVEIILIQQKCVIFIFTSIVEHFHIRRMSIANWHNNNPRNFWSAVQNVTFKGISIRVAYWDIWDYWDPLAHIYHSEIFWPRGDTVSV